MTESDVISIDLSEVFSRIKRQRVLRVTITKHGSRINVRNDERTWIYNARSQAEIETFDTRGGTIKR